MYVGVDEHHLNVNAVVAASCVPLTLPLATTHHVWNLKIIVMTSNFPSRIRGQDTRIDTDLVRFEGRDVYAGVDEHSLNANAVVAASYVP